MPMKYVDLSVLGLALALPIGVCQAQPQTNTITTPNGVNMPYFFAVNGAGSNPPISLTAGVTNVFVINTPAGVHPVIITTNPPFTLGNYSGATYPGGSPQSPQGTNSGEILLNAPAAGFPTKLYYVCSVHFFFGEIDLSSAIGSPPPNTILQIKVGTNIVMTSTGTNTTWTLVPQYSTNIANRLWTPVPGYNNSFSNGTNTTVFDRLDSTAGPKVFLRLSQQPPP